MMSEEKQRKQRKDFGTTRVINVRKPEVFTISLKGHGIDAQIGQAIENDIKRLAKAGKIATHKTVLVEWLVDYLGLKEQS